MSKHITMTAALRDRAGKGNARATRRSGKVPAVIYGDSKPPVLIALDNVQITKALHSGHLFTHLCDLTVDGQKHTVLARDVQLHPIKDTPDHVDFLRVSEKTVITVEVPIHVTGQDKSPGIKAGAVLNIVLHTLEVSCRADMIPEEIVVDISDMDITDTIKIGDVKLPANVKAVADADDTLISMAIVEEEVEAPVTPAGPIEVVTTAQKNEGDEEAAPADAKGKDKDKEKAKDEKKK
jgi:large subunit ribosomal protein L25